MEISGSVLVAAELELHGPLLPRNTVRSHTTVTWVFLLTFLCLFNFPTRLNRDRILSFQNHVLVLECPVLQHTKSIEVE